MRKGRLATVPGPNTVSMWPIKRMCALPLPVKVATTLSGWPGASAGTASTAAPSAYSRGIRMSSTLRPPSASPEPESTLTTASSSFSWSARAASAAAQTFLSGVGAAGLASADAAASTASAAQPPIRPAIVRFMRWTPLRPRQGSLSSPPSAGGHPPDHAAHVIGHQKRAGAVEGDAHRATLHLTLGLHEAAQHGDRLTGRLAASEGHEHHLVAVRIGAVPRAVLTHERAAPVLGRKGRAGVEGHAQRRYVRAQGVVGRYRLLHQVRHLGLHAGVHVLSVVAVRPAVETSVLHRGQVVGHEIVAALVTLVGHGPQGACARLPAHAVGVADAAGELAHAARSAVHLLDRRAAVFGGHADLSDDGVGVFGFF